MADDFRGAGSAIVDSYDIGAEGLRVRLRGLTAGGAYVDLAVDNDGNLIVVGTLDAGTGPWPVTDNGSSLTVDGTVAVSSLPALPSGSNNIGDVDVLSTPETEAAYDTGSYDATALTASFATKLTLSNVTTIRSIMLTSTADQRILVSANGSTADVTLPPYSSQVLDYKANQLKETGNISAKHDGTVPARGRLYVTAVGV